MVFKIGTTYLPAFIVHGAGYLSERDIEMSAQNYAEHIVNESLLKRR
ncbi:hypothetical protein [Bacillus sp. 165]|nr:hypothetical protein [Bacillus sp. 165]MBO9129968.1 hypothetical protein [Bacillus sp. 165]